MGSILEIGRAADGFVVRIGGRGSVHESPGLKALVTEALDASPTAVFTIDLSDCDYLDSTFLGCMIGLHAKFNSRGAKKVQVAGSDQKLGELFGPSGLERVLPRSPGTSDDVQQWLEVPTAELKREELGQHLVECHRRLAQTGGPQADAFAAVADEIEREITSPRR